MTRQYTYKTNFSAGELSPRLFGRGDIKAWENGGSRLRNVVLQPTGGLTRRPGMHFLAEVPGKARMIAFEFNTEQIFLLVLSHFRMDVYQDGYLVAGNISAPWPRQELDHLNWVQNADTLFVAHPQFQTRRITRTGFESWTITPFDFTNKGVREMIPHFKFATRDATLTPSGTTGSVRLTASEPVFAEQGHIGVPFRLSGGMVRITAVVSETEADAEVRVDLEHTTPTKDWTEAAVSQVRGWPRTVAFHQNRLVLGGMRDLPNHIWMSEINDIYSFDLGTGESDEAIHFELLSDQVNAIRGMLSGTNLQVLTSGGEWLVTGDPLTPASVQVKRQARIGSRSDRQVPPRVVEGTTLFVSRNGDAVNEFALADVDQVFQVADLSLLAGHFVKDVVDLDYQHEDRLVYAVLGDGTIGALTQFRAEEVTAWTRIDTEGTILGATVVREFVYLLVERANGYFLEVLEPELEVDAGLSGTANPATVDWSGLEHLEGQEVAIVADGRVLPRQSVSDGAVTLETPASEVTVGLPFAHEIEPLPPLATNAIGTDHGIKIRLIQATFRLLESHALTVDVGQGLHPVPFQSFGDGLLDQPMTAFSGDKPVRALGWRASGMEPLWRIESDTPLPFTLLSVTMEIKVND